MLNRSFRPLYNFNRVLFTNKVVFSLRPSRCASTSLPTELNDDTIESTAIKKRPISRAMKAYLEHAKAHDELMRKARIEYQIGKRHLANMMGENPETFTQEDVDEAITYLFPSGLYSAKARPMMKPPEEIFKGKKSVEFDETGRPYSFLFYTASPNVYQIIYETTQHIYSLYQYEDEMYKKGEHPNSSLQLNTTGFSILSRDQLEAKMLERIKDKVYENFCRTLQRLMEMPYSYTKKDFIFKWLVTMTSQMKIIIPYETKIDEVGREFVKIYCARRGHARADVTMFSPGTGKITVNGYDITYFEEIKERDMAEKGL